jgi:hypothetical protein
MVHRQEPKEDEEEGVLGKGEGRFQREGSLCVYLQ